MAANPCRCSAEDPSQCRCNPHERMNYLSNLSGPLRDRLDMVVTLSGQAATINAEGEEESAVIAERVAAAPAVQRRDGVGLAQPQRPQHRGVRLGAVVVDLVGHEHDRLLVAAQQLHDAATAVGETTIVSRTGGAPTLAYGMSQIMTDLTGAAAARVRPVTSSASIDVEAMEIEHPRAS